MTVNKLSERESNSLSTSQQSALLLGTMKDVFIRGWLNKDSGIYVNSGKCHKLPLWCWPQPQLQPINMITVLEVHIVFRHKGTPCDIYLNFPETLPAAIYFGDMPQLTFCPGWNFTLCFHCRKRTVPGITRSPCDKVNNGLIVLNTTEGLRWAFSKGNTYHVAPEESNLC